jgi:hypothetical protein
MRHVHSVMTDVTDVDVERRKEREEKKRTGVKKKT